MKLFQTSKLISILLNVASRIYYLFLLFLLLLIIIIIRAVAEIVSGVIRNALMFTFLVVH